MNEGQSLVDRIEKFLSRALVSAISFKLVRVCVFVIQTPFVKF